MVVTKEKAAIYQQFETQATGLTTSAAKSKLATHGHNILEQGKKPSLVRRIIGQLTDVTTIILVIATAISAYLAIAQGSSWLKVWVIGSIIILNVVIALYQEASAEKALEALQKLSTQAATVLRDGETTTVSAEELVPGDILILKAGDAISADARLIEVNNLLVEEAVLTGESLPVEKSAVALSEQPASLGDQVNMVFSGTAVAQGNGQAVVCATGMATEIGKIANLLNHTEKQKTMLQKRMDQLGTRLTTVAVVAGLFIFFLNMFYNNETLLESLMLGISLAVAAVPETLPVIVTIALTNGVSKMAKRQAIVRRLTAVETIGNVTVICTDKTGTLTQNKMTITQFFTPSGGQQVKEIKDLTPEQQTFLTYLGLATNAKLATTGSEDEGAIGDATEIAILRLLAKLEMSREQLEQDYPRLGEDPFDSTKKTMATLHGMPDGQYLLIVKGALERLPFSQTIDQKAVKAAHNRFAGDALRVLGLGYRILNEKPNLDQLSQVTSDLIFGGLIGLIDPPRPEVMPAIEQAKAAGITTVMITGDHQVTAKAIAQEIGISTGENDTLTGAQLAQVDDETLQKTISQYRVFARVSPTDKIRIVKAWQQNDETVAMTGDGVNDAPALKAADVGIAMGITGTDVAKNAADMILTDDNFATIIEAVETGRTVYHNIRKAIEFLVGVNFAQIFIMLLSVFFGWGGALIAEQLLLINVLADGIPGFYISFEGAERGIMHRKPVHKNISLFADGLGLRMAIRSITFILLVLGNYALGRFILALPTQNAVLVGMTMAFLVLAIGSIIDVFPIKQQLPLQWENIGQNKRLLYAVLLSISLVLLVTFTPFLQAAFRVTSLTALQWSFVLPSIFIPSIILELVKRVQLRKSTNSVASKLEQGKQQFISE